MKLPNFEFDENQLIKIMKDYEIKEVYLFGSILTNSFRKESVINIWISYQNQPIGLFELMDLNEKIKNVYHREIDIVEKEALRKHEMRSLQFHGNQL